MKKITFGRAVSAVVILVALSASGAQAQVLEEIVRNRSEASGEHTGRSYIHQRYVPGETGQRQIGW